MAAPREPDSDPDSVDPQTGAPEDASVDRLMEQAEALARELGAEVGTPEQPSDVTARQSDGPRKPLPGIMAQVGRAERAASQVAEELGSDQGRMADSADVLSGPKETATSIPDPDPAEWKGRDAGAPALGDGTEARARAPVAQADGAALCSETSGVPQGARGSGEPIRFVPVRGPVRSLGLKCLEASRKVLVLAVRLNWRMSDVGRRWLERSRPVHRHLYAFIGLLDRPFAWVPRSVRAPLGYVALATLFMALLTFVVGWML